MIAPKQPPTAASCPAFSDTEVSLPLPRSLRIYNQLLTILLGLSLANYNSDTDFWSIFIFQRRISFISSFLLSSLSWKADFSLNWATFSYKASALFFSRSSYSRILSYFLRIVLASSKPCQRGLRGCTGRLLSAISQINLKYTNNFAINVSELDPAVSLCPLLIYCSQAAIDIINLKLMLKPLFVWMALLTLCYPQNVSVCAQFSLGSYYYFINTNINTIDIVTNTIDRATNTPIATSTYNLCQTVDVYCPLNNLIYTASYVELTSLDCNAYQQANVSFINPTDGLQGISIIYKLIGGTNGSAANAVTVNFPCVGGVGSGCADTSSSILWSYFDGHQLVFTIVLEIIGLILMTLGIYIYRGSIVLLGWASAFIILVSIESNFVFQDGVPDSLIKNVLILTAICSFLAGYILGYFPKAGVFCMGLWLGMVLALTLNNIAFYRINTDPSALVLFIMLPVLAVLFGLLMLFIRKTFIIVTSSLIGAYLCLRALSWYLGAFPNQFLLSKMYNLGLVGSVPWQFYLYVVALFILTASTSALQNWLFKMKAQKSNGSADVEKHFERLEDSLKKQREDLVKFEDVFDKSPVKPKVLQKSSKHMPVKEEEEEDEDSEESEAQPEPLRKKLLGKGKA